MGGRTKYDTLFIVLCAKHKKRNKVDTFRGYLIMYDRKYIGIWSTDQITDQGRQNNGTNETRQPQLYLKVYCPFQNSIPQYLIPISI